MMNRVHLTRMFGEAASMIMSVGTKNVLRSAVLAAGLLTAGVATAEAASFYVIQLSYKNRWDRAFDVHFAPSAGFGQSDCKQSLQKAIDEYGPDLNAAFKRNFGSEVESFNRAVFVDGKCQAFDVPPGQTFNLKISG